MRRAARKAVQVKWEPREDRKDCKVPQIQRQSHPSEAMKGRPSPAGTQTSNTMLVTLSPRHLKLCPREVIWHDLGT